MFNFEKFFNPANIFDSEIFLNKFLNVGYF